MALSKFEQANLNRLKACVKPVQTKIDRIKSKLAEHIEEANKELEVLNSQIVDYTKMISALELKGTEVSLQIQGNAPSITVASKDSSSNIESSGNWVNTNGSVNINEIDPTWERQ